LLYRSLPITTPDPLRIFAEVRLILGGGEVGRFNDPARPYPHPEDVDIALRGISSGLFVTWVRLVLAHNNLAYLCGLDPRVVSAGSS